MYIEYHFVEIRVHIVCVFTRRHDFIFISPRTAVPLAAICYFFPVTKIISHSLCDRPMIIK